MDLQGKIIAVLPERSGVSARGEWKAGSFVIETHDTYPKKMVFDVFGADRLAQFAIKVGEELIVSFDIDAHEYQGRWYNSIRAWNIQRVDPAAVAGAQPGMMPGAFPPPPAMGAAPAASPVASAAPAAPVAPAGGATAPFPQSQDNGGSADDLPF